MAHIFSDISFFPWFPDFYLTKGGGSVLQPEAGGVPLLSLGSPIRFYSDQKG